MRWLAAGLLPALVLQTSVALAWITLPNMEPVQLIRVGATHTQVLTSQYSVGSTGLAAQYMWFDSYTAVVGNAKVALDTKTDRSRGWIYDGNFGVALGAMAQGGFSLGIGLGSDGITRPGDNTSRTLPPAFYGYLRPQALLPFHKCFYTTIDVDGSLRSSRSHALKAQVVASFGCARVHHKPKLRYNLGVSWQWYPGIDLASLGGLLGVELLFR